MCGIVGQWNLNGEHVEKETLEKMCDSIRHRGPDSEGYHIDGNLGLGHRRLSIIDLSDAGKQPMSNEDGSIWLVFNGEIYNFVELRESLQKEHKFKSNTDSEVLIHLYEQYGIECLEYLRGMFAFAIWDRKKELLFLARDRVGKKPLYYTFKDEKLIFASEAKSLFASGLLVPEPDFEGLELYLYLGYVPAPYSAFKGVNKIPPAHYMIIDKSGKLTLEKYWSLSFTEKLDLSEEEWKTKIREQIKEAVKIRLRSDVPLGVFLSGGIDSSAIVAFASEFLPKVKTYSIGFTYQDYDERKYARIVAERFNTDHHEFVVEPKLAEIIDTYMEAYDEPFGDSSGIPSLYVSKIAKEEVTVILNGDGGDENFAGYPRYQAFWLRSNLRYIPFLDKMRILANVIPDGKTKSIFRRIKRFVSMLSLDENEMYEKLLYIYEFDEILKLIGPNWKNKHHPSKDYVSVFFDKVNTLGGIDKVLSIDINSYLPEDLLVKMDRATMSFSLEARSPLLDHVFMEEMAKIPPRLKLRFLTTKHIFKESLKGILPDEILDRQKMGFGAPLEHWFRNDLKEYVRDTLLGGELIKNKILNRHYVEQIVNEHISKTKNHQYRIWVLLILELWWRKWITKNYNFDK